MRSRTKRKLNPREKFPIYGIWHAYSTNDALSKDIKVNDLDFNLCAKNSFLDFVAAGGIVSVSQTHLDFSYCFFKF